LFGDLQDPATLATIVAAAVLVGPAQVGARLPLLALEGRLSLRRSGPLAASSPVPGTSVLAGIGPGPPLLWLFPVPDGVGNGMLTIVPATALVDWSSSGAAARSGR